MWAFAPFFCFPRGLCAGSFVRTRQLSHLDSVYFRYNLFLPFFYVCAVTSITTKIALKRKAGGVVNPAAVKQALSVGPSAAKAQPVVPVVVAHSPPPAPITIEADPLPREPSSPSESDRLKEQTANIERLKRDIQRLEQDLGRARSESGREIEWLQTSLTATHQALAEAQEQLQSCVSGSWDAGFARGRESGFTLGKEAYKSHNEERLKELFAAQKAREQQSVAAILHREQVIVQREQAVAQREQAVAEHEASRFSVPSFAISAPSAVELPSIIPPSIEDFLPVPFLPFFC